MLYSYPTKIIYKIFRTIASYGTITKNICWGALTARRTLSLQGKMRRNYSPDCANRSPLSVMIYQINNLPTWKLLVIWVRKLGCAGVIAVICAKEALKQSKKIWITRTFRAVAYPSKGQRFAPSVARSLRPRGRTRNIAARNAGTPICTNVCMIAVSTILSMQGN